MCSNLYEIQGGIKIACRKCNQCLTARKNGWVARAMAEKATSKETFVITLTYDEKAQESRDAAKVFVYKDIKDYMKRLRQAIKRKTGETGKLRFIVAGELGSDNGRCHWHIVLYSEVDLLSIGEWSHWWTGEAVQQDEVIEHCKKRKRIDWTLWKKGFVDVQIPDQGGIEYALAYALKDQFNIVNSQGTMRESKSEHHSSGYFRMSKKPPIGHEWLENHLNTLAGKQAVPVSLNLKVPEYRGYWHPTGPMRENMLLTIYEINQCVKRRAGRAAPQMTALLATVVDQEKEWEMLKNGEYKEELDDDIAARIALASRERETRTASSKAIRRNCGSFHPCKRCAASNNAEQNREIAEIAIEAGKNAKDGGNDYDTIWRKKNKPSPYCVLKDTEQTRKAFGLPA